MPRIKVATAVLNQTPMAWETNTRNIIDAIDEARRHYQSAIDAQRDGDWAKYGTEIKTLGQLLERLGNRPAAEAPERVPPAR